jgi:outer membrane lipoprotein carrier protein
MLLDGSTVSLTQDFTVSLAKAAGDWQVFKLMPRKKDSLFQMVYLTFKQKQLQQMRLVDNLGQATIINFSHVIVNPSLASNLFTFVPPKGVDVVTQ